MPQRAKAASRLGGAIGLAAAALFLSWLTACAPAPRSATMPQGTGAPTSEAGFTAWCRDHPGLGLCP